MTFLKFQSVDLTFLKFHSEKLLVMYKTLELGSMWYHCTVCGKYHLIEVIVEKLMLNKQYQ